MAIIPPTSQASSAEVYATTDLDGIAYRSRLDPDRLCLALFDDAHSKLKLMEEGDPIDRDRVGYTLVQNDKQLVGL